MSLYLSPEIIQSAVDRLGKSCATPTLTDFLIFKRALVLERQDARANSIDPESVETVTTGTLKQTFVQAVFDLAAYDPSEAIQERFYCPMGAFRDKTKGFRKKNYHSNGSSDTAGRWQSRNNPPLVLVKDTKPKQFSFTHDVTPNSLRSFFHVAGIGAPLPKLIDVAVWFFRAIDLQDAFGESPTEEDLIAGLVSNLALNSMEILALFEPLSPTTLAEPL